MRLGNFRVNETVGEEITNESFVYETVNAWINNKTLSYHDFFEMIDYLKELIVFYCDECKKYHIFEKDFNKIGTFKNGTEFLKYYIITYL